MTAFELLQNVARYGGVIEMRDGALSVRCMRDDARIVRLTSRNSRLVANALRNPDRWPCKKFNSHPTTPTLPCRDCGQGWAAHPHDLQLGHPDRPT